MVCYRPSVGAQPADAANHILNAAGADADAVAAQAARALDAGAIAGLPTETVYGLAIGARDAEAAQRLWSVRSKESPAGDSARLLTWHVSDAAAILDAAPVRSAAQRLLVHRLAPGPVTFSFEMDEQECAALCSRFGAARGVFEDGTQALLRAPAPLVTRRVLQLAKPPVVIISLPIAGQAARSASEAADVLAQTHSGDTDPVAGSILLVDDGQYASGRQSTLIRFGRSGDIETLREGVIEDRFIRKQLRMNIVFVCTGNTCRSPMAAAIARDLLSHMDTGGLEVVVRSAGVGAHSGFPATREAVEALQRLGVDPGSHASCGLSREAIAQADRVYTMTRSHLEAARAIDRSAADRIELLDLSGRDIPDPIGLSQDVYDQTARVIRDAVEARLKELLNPA